MDHFRYRGSVKVISYIDMTFSLVVIVLTVLASIGVFLATVHDQGYQELRLFFLQGNSKRLNDGRKALTDLGRTFTIIWILSFTFNILQFFAGCALLSGTDMVIEDDDEEDSKSVQKCRFWQCTSLFLFLFIIALVYLYPTPFLLGFGVGEFLFRAVGIYIVGKFVGELEEENNINSSSAQLYYYDTDPTDTAEAPPPTAEDPLLENPRHHHQQQQQHQPQYFQQQQLQHPQQQQQQHHLMQQF